MAYRKTSEQRCRTLRISPMHHASQFYAVHLAILAVYFPYRPRSHIRKNIILERFNISEAYPADHFADFI